MLYSKVFLAVLALSVHAVSAGLYPTQPIAKTVFRGAQMNNVTWVDSESKPTMYALGKIRMELYVDNTRFLTTLATDVDARKMRQEVFIKPSLWSNASNYHIRFKPENSQETIYTADFTVVDMTGSCFGSSENLYTALQTGTSTLSPIATTPAVMDAKQGSEQVSDSEMVTVTMEATPGALGAPPPPPLSTGSTTTNSASSSGRPLRKSSMRFNLVFILWPALFGIALAL